MIADLADFPCRRFRFLTLSPYTFCLYLPSPDSATMGTTAPGPVNLLDLCDQKLLDFVYNVDNKDFMWLKEIEEEAERMFVR